VRPHAGVQGTNDFGKTHYGGPSTFWDASLFFKIFALDTKLELKNPVRAAPNSTRPCAVMFWRRAIDGRLFTQNKRAFAANYPDASNNSLRVVVSPYGCDAMENCGRDFSILYPRLIMGVLNVTPDSFSDGGRFFQAPQALAQLEK